MQFTQQEMGENVRIEEAEDALFHVMEGFSVDTDYHCTQAGNH